ncbi:MAG: hypothetical protein OHK0023_20670 [Anaerolineae bacterium]
MTYKRSAVAMCIAFLCAFAVVLVSFPASPSTAAPLLATNTARPTRIITQPPPPTNTLRPSQVPSATVRPGRPTRTPQPTLVIEGTYITPEIPPATAIPFPMATPVPTGDDILTILLLGSDTVERDSTARTDVIVIVVINRTAGSVSMLHFPRDLFVYAPNDTMRKINTVAARGIEMYGKGGGVRLMKETLLYNFGIKVDRYARVGFTQFQDIIQLLGGLDISVDCAIQGNRLKSPELDPSVADNYEVYTLNIGRHKLEPYMALWYVRSRGSSSDVDRGRRQIEVLTAIWRQARAAGLITQVTELFPRLLEIVDTDITFQDAVGLVPLALALEPNQVQRISLRQNTHFEEWYTTDTGSFAWLPIREAWEKVIQDLYLPPSPNRLGGESPRVAVAAAPQLKGYDQVVADRLAWEGYAVQLLGQQGAVNRDTILITDYTGGAKPQSLELLRKTLRVGNSQVVVQPDPNATVDFRVDMGRDYISSCMYSLPDLPVPTATPGS